MFTSGRQRRALPRAVWLLVTARAVNRLGAFSVPFLTVLLTTDFGAGLATAGLVTAAFGLATIPSRLAGGRLADRLGRRRTIVLGLTGCALAQLGIATAGSLPVATAFAVLLGLAFELYEPPSQAFIADSVDADQRVRAYSLLNAAFAVGGIGAGLIATALGRSDLRWLFVADAVSCSACALVIRFGLPADRAAYGHGARASDTGVRPWHDRALIVLLTAGTVFAVLYLQVVIALPLTVAAYGLPPADAGLLFTVSALTVVVAQPAMRIRRLSTMPGPAALAMGSLLMAAGLAGYAAADGLPALMAATVLWGLGEFLMLARSFSIVADLAPPRGSGRYLAVYGVSWGIAGVAAPILGTQIVHAAGTTALWAGMASVCLALAAAHLLVVQPLIARDARVRVTATGHFTS